MKHPAVEITSGDSRLVCLNTLVKGSAEGGTVIEGKRTGQSFFRKGEKVLDLHIDSTDAREMAMLIKTLGRTVPRLKGAGFAEIYVITPNHALLRSLTRAIPSSEYVQPHPEEVRWARRHYVRRMSTHGFPDKYRNTEVRAMAANF